MDEIRAIFAHFDLDNDGKIGIEELSTVMKSLGHNPTSADLEDMIKEVDLNGNL
ncbi:hypothetical protein O3M35_003090 [Rhynocoris fuscipes]|uniref:EF-hand domain-containing protein n=1 Tax=Rhynocoris fuscipes TaxID=488301 RepID=A0AAW1CK81_9HEMI